MELARWIAAYRFLRSVDVVIVPGTGILDDFGERPWGMPLSLLRWSLLTRLTRTRLAFVGIGAGPVQSRVSRLIFRLALSFADNCSYRDTGSRDYMRSIGRDTQADGVIPDIVFALEVPHLEPVTDTMGVGVMAYYGWSNSQHKGEATYQRYIEALTETVKQLRADGWRIRLLVGEASDERAVKDIMGRLACKSPEVNELVASRITSMDDLIGELNRVGVVFATRYHNVVGALLAGRPVISAGYAPKNDWLLEQVGLREYCQSVEDFRPSKVVESSRRLRKELPVRFREISAQTNEWKLLVEAGFRAALASKR
jgi:polysaccharide pyruvyl transferase WcaK-like protein